MFLRDCSKPGMTCSLVTDRKPTCLITVGTVLFAGIFFGYLLLSIQQPCPLPWIVVTDTQRPSSDFTAGAPSPSLYNTSASDLPVEGSSRPRASPYNMQLHATASVSSGDSHWNNISHTSVLTAENTNKTSFHQGRKRIPTNKQKSNRTSFETPKIIKPEHFSRSRMEDMTAAVMKHSLSETSARRPKLILLWSDLYRDPNWSVQTSLKNYFLQWNSCREKNCLLTKDKSLVAKADAVLTSRLLREETNGSQTVDDPPPRSNSNQVFVLAWYESPIYTPEWALKAFEGVFNMTITYREESDITVPYGKLLWKQRPSSAAYRLPLSQLRLKTRHVAWVISHCSKVGGQRNEYVNELKKHIPVDVYGQCGKPCPPRYSEQTDCFQYIEEKYKFYLAFENSFCADYVTEKLFRTLSLNLVPVIMGGANYANILPGKYAINVLDFDSPGELAKYLLYLDKDDSAYQEYFSWKSQYFVQDVHYLRRQLFCRICEILHDASYPYLGDFSLRSLLSADQCITGPRLRQKLGI